MKVLLLKDVYKLGRAGDVKRVADGYGRNFLLPQKLAVLATPAAITSAERIREKANIQRAIVNKEMDTVAKQLDGLVLVFPARASETGKLYGSITTQMIGEAIQAKRGVEVARRQIDTQPLRTLGEYKVHVRLTVDLIPEISVIVHREGEAVNLPGRAVAEAAPAEKAAVVEAAPVELPAVEEAAPAEEPAAEE
jgi:large subunit ribosomal protein L9